MTRNDTLLIFFTDRVDVSHVLKTGARRATFDRLVERHAGKLALIEAS